MMRKAVSMILTAAMAGSLAVAGSTAVYASDVDIMNVYAPDMPEIEGSDVEAEFDICVYYGGDSTTMAEYAAQEINKKFPNVTINFEAIPQDGGQTIKTRAAAGDLPDILLVDSGTISTLSKSGNIIPLDEYVDKFNISNYYTDAIMESCLYSDDGHVYQFPMQSISPILWYYNSQLFEDNGIKVPENYEELLETVKAFREKGITPMAMFGKEPWPLGAFFDSFAMKGNPEGLYALSKGEATASDEAYQTAINRIKELIDAGLFQEGSTNADFDTASALFTSGQAAMFLDGSWYTSEAIVSLPDTLSIFTAYPTCDKGNTENLYATAGGGDTCGMAITDSADDKELAAEIAFLFAYYREVAHYESTGLIETPLKTDDLQLAVDIDPVSEKLAEVIAGYSYNGKYVHTLPNTEFGTLFTEEMQKLLVGESADDFIANINKAIEKTTK